MAGRKSVYETNIKPRLPEIKEWRKVGGTVENMCEILGVSQATFFKYLKQETEFAEAYKKGTTEFVMDLRGELAKLAKKHTLETVKVYKKKDVETGAETQYQEKTVKEVDADIAAINLLLKNLDKENWSNDPRYVQLREQELELKKMLAEAKEW